LNKKKKKKNKKIKEKNKGKNGLGKNTSMTGTTHLLQRHPQITSCIPGSHFTHMTGHPHPHHLTYMAWMKPSWKLPLSCGY
jgi:hypothetical protein